MRVNHKYSNYFFVALFLIIAIVSFFVIKDLILATLYSVVLALLLYPLYNKINSLLKIKWLSAIIVILLLIFIVTIPLVFISNQLIKESMGFYNSIKLLEPQLPNFVREGIQNILVIFSNMASDFLFSLPARLLSIFVSLFLLFYLFIEGDKIFNSFKEMLPLDEKKKNLLFNEFKQISYSVFYGVILSGIIIGILSGIGYYIFDVKSPILLAFITFILVILPVVGSALVWVPLGILKIYNGDMFNGIGLLLYGVLIISLLDPVLKYILIRKKINLHPLIIVIGVIGGLKFFGFIGIIFGPFIIGLFITMLKYLIIEK